MKNNRSILYRYKEIEIFQVMCEVTEKHAGSLSVSTFKNGIPKIGFSTVIRHFGTFNAFWGCIFL